MTKASVDDWSTDQSANLDLDDIGLGEGVTRVPAFNDLVRHLMAQLATKFAGLVPSVFSTTGSGKGYLFGLTLSNDSGTPNTKIDIAAGTCRDSTNADFLTLSAIVKTTGSWAVGTGNGGLDSGTVGNSTWYHVFAIKRVDTGVTDVLLSASATSPTLPTNYTLFRRIGSFLTDSSAHIVAFTQRGDEFLWGAPVQDKNNAAYGAITAILTALTVPTSIQVNALFAYSLFRASADADVLVTSPDQADTAATSAAFTMAVIAAGATTSLPMNIRTDTSGRIRERSSVTDATRYIFTNGWIDTRGRLA